MDKETKTDEVRKYLKNVWHKADEEPTMYNVPMLVIDKAGNYRSYGGASDYAEWLDIVYDNNLAEWAYIHDFCPVTPDLKDYRTIRTYKDACTALGERVDEVELTEAGVPRHIIALMKLELVCKALWGGEVKVYPDAGDNRWYYYPWFVLYTKDEISGMSSEERGLLLSATAHNGVFAGWGSADTTYRSSYSDAYSGFRLCLDTEEKALYFGQQFVELWAEYLTYNFTVGGRLE